jgi:hypothetical protein
MPVFPSHKREDTAEALYIGRYLRDRGVICYIDVMDPTIATTEDLTQLLRSRVRTCTHLMAVVSANTERSWWVPFEIGVASELERRITTFRTALVSLPDYLTKWPILSTTQDLDRFVYYYFMDVSVEAAERRFAMPLIRSAGDFHATLKQALGQR